MIIGNERAFPVAGSYNDESPEVLIPIDGLTIRQEFAKAAMQGLLTTLVADSDNWSPNKENIDYCVGLSVIAADALIEQLNK